MSVSDTILKLYQRFYAQKKVLADGPALTIDVNTMGIASFPQDKALAEMAAMVSYLLGIADVRKKSYDDVAGLIEKAYDGQDFWQNLLYDYLDLTLDIEESTLKQQGVQLKAEMESALTTLNEAEEKREAIIQHFADKIAAKKFHVDGVALIRNYFKMQAKDEKEAWKTLITNPAYFSPIQTMDEKGKVILTPSQAMDENKNLGHFLKKLKG